MATAPLRDDELAAWKAFLRAQATVLRALEREMEADSGLPIGFYDVLVTLSDSGGSLRMSELADRVVLSRSGVTRMVDRMEREGLVERRQCATDRRGYDAVLTTAGKKALRRAWPVHARGVAEHFARHLEPGEVELLTRALGRMSETEDDQCPWAPADEREARVSDPA